jgi:uncharacterized protein involved in exopolysaccharide biosynthesis
MNDFGLQPVTTEIWRQRWVIATAMGAALIFGLFAILILGRTYTATMVVAPEPSNLSMEPERFSPSRLLGMVAPDSTAPIEAYTTLLTSRIVANRLARDQDLMRAIFPASWDARAERWRRPPGSVEALKDFVRLVLGRRAWAPPDGVYVQSFLKRVHIAPIKSNLISASSIHRISFESSNGFLAQRVLSAIHRAADDVLRDRNRVDVESQIGFLNNELSRPYSNETREALIRALGSLQQRRVMLNSQGDYAIMLLDPPNFSPTPTFPKPSFILGSCFVFGALASGLLVVAFWGRALPRQFAPTRASGRKRAPVFANLRPQMQTDAHSGTASRPMASTDELKRTNFTQSTTKVTSQ